MRKPPPISQILHYPITGGVCLLAIGVTLAWMTGHPISALTMSGVHFWDQPWRMITSIFPHVGIYHIAFNVYWTWVFGTLLEKEFGHWRVALIILILAAGSGVAELAVLVGGVGLSGVVYGLFGMLWVLTRRDPRFAGAIDQRTITMFVAWFFLCIVLTALKIMPVANVAHGMGAVLGAIMGWVVVSRQTRRQMAGAVLAAVMLVIFLGATVLRLWVNFSSHAGDEYINAACNELAAQRPENALPLLKTALTLHNDDGLAPYNMGVAYDDLGNYSAARASFLEAARIRPDEEPFRTAAKNAQKRAASGTQPATAGTP